MLSPAPCAPSFLLPQVVGHTAAQCDVGGAEGRACQPVRASSRAVGVDGAMYWGNRAFLELTVGGGGAAPAFVSRTLQPDGTWLARSLTRGPACGQEMR